MPYIKLPEGVWPRKQNLLTTKIHGTFEIERNRFYDDQDSRTFGEAICFSLWKSDQDS